MHAIFKNGTSNYSKDNLPLFITKVENFKRRKGILASSSSSKSSSGTARTQATKPIPQDTTFTWVGKLDLHPNQPCKSWKSFPVSSTPNQTITRRNAPLLRLPIPSPRRTLCPIWNTQIGSSSSHPTRLDKKHKDGVVAVPRFSQVADVATAAAINKHAWKPKQAKIYVHKKFWHQRMKKLKFHSLVMVPAPVPVQISSPKKIHLYQEPY